MLLVWLKIPQMPLKFQPNLSAQKFQIFEKKLSLGVRSPWFFQNIEEDWRKYFVPFFWTSAMKMNYQRQIKTCKNPGSRGCVSRVLIEDDTHNVSEFHHLWTTFTELFHCVACRSGSECSREIKSGCDYRKGKSVQGAWWPQSKQCAMDYLKYCTV